MVEAAKSAPSATAFRQSVLTAPAKLAICFFPCQPLVDAGIQKFRYVPRAHFLSTRYVQDTTVWVVS